MEPTAILLTTAIQEVVKYAVPKTLNQLLAILAQLQTRMSPERLDGGAGAFPSAALIGLGHCGTNVSLEVARLLHEATDGGVQQHAAPIPSMVDRLRAMMGRSSSEGLYLFEPVIFLADLDHDYSEDLTVRNAQPVPGYSRCKLVKLDWLYREGAGNLPQIGQYMARVALKVPFDNAAVESNPVQPSSASVDWLPARSYFLDSIGLRENQTRLTCFLFSTGGGTGSGMGSEFGVAQGFLNFKRAHERATAASPNATQMMKVGEKDRFDLLEAPCSIGFGVMPAITPFDTFSGNRAGADAQSVNTGRALAAFLARWYRFAQLQSDPTRPAPVVSEIDWVPFNALFLISNDIMNPLAKNAKDHREAERTANTYIAQQIFGLLITQSLPTDYSRQPSSDPRSPERDLTQTKQPAIDRGLDLERFDPADLKNSLTGLTVVAYAQDDADAKNPINIDGLIRRALALPSANGNAIEGISLLPLSRDEYEPMFQTPDDDALFTALTGLAVFKRAQKVVAILSVPRDFSTPQSVIDRLKGRLATLFPEAIVRRVGLVREASKQVAVSIFIGGSAALSAEAYRHIITYLQDCFRADGVSTDDFETAVQTYLQEVTPGTVDIGAFIREVEDMTAVMGESGGGLVVKQNQVEGWASGLLGDARPSLHEILLSRKDCMDALAGLRKCFQHSGNYQPDARKYNALFRQSA